MVFNDTLPVKPSVTTTSTSPEKISSPSTKPAVIDRRARQAPVRRAQFLGALDVFFADVQQTDARIRDAMQVGRDHGAHDGELHELVGAAVGIRAEIEHHGVTV